MKIEIISECPSCASTLERVRDQLFCRNKECSAKSFKSILHYIKALKIKGLGEKTVEKLNITCIADIYSLNKEYVYEIIGEKLGDKLLNEIELAKEVDFATYISAFGIPLVGKTIATKLAAVISDTKDISLEVCKQAGIGDKASANLVSWASSFTETNPIKVLSTKVVTKSFSKHVCITGKIPNFTRGALEDLLSSNGIKLDKSVTGKTTYLVTNESERNSSKCKSALSKGLPILTFDEFLTMENIVL